MKRSPLPIVGQEASSADRGAAKLPRRDFLLLVVGWFGTLGSVGAAAVAGLRGLLPNLLDEPEQRFRAGKPQDYADGAVEFLSDIRTFLLRQDDRIRAMSAVCTHLGCTVNRDGSTFRCPCHGSVFDQDGTVLKGPAPSPLESYAVAMARDGRLVIDRDERVSPEQALVVRDGESAVDLQAAEGAHSRGRT